MNNWNYDITDVSKNTLMYLWSKAYQNYVLANLDRETKSFHERISYGRGRDGVFESLDNIIANITEMGYTGAKIILRSSWSSHRSDFDPVILYSESDHIFITLKSSKHIHEWQHDISQYLLNRGFSFEELHSRNTYILKVKWIAEAEIVLIADTSNGILTALISGVPFNDIMA